MKWQQLVIDLYERISQELETALDGLTLDDLNKQLFPGCNSIGWLTWHLTRSQDKIIAELLGEDQLWTKDNWYAKFNRAFDPLDTGIRHSIEDTLTFSSPSASTLLEYHHTVFERSKRYITSTLSETELDREFEKPKYPNVINVRTSLMRLINDNIQHLGQINYVRGILKEWDWLGR